MRTATVIPFPMSKAVANRIAGRMLRVVDQPAFTDVRKFVPGIRAANDRLITTGE